MKAFPIKVVRPVLLSVQRKSGHLERHFHSARAAAQWLRRSSDSSNEVQHWDEDSFFLGWNGMKDEDFRNFRLK